VSQTARDEYTSEAVVSNYERNRFTGYLVALTATAPNKPLSKAAPQIPDTGATSILGLPDGHQAMAAKPRHLATASHGGR
jgi:hypothetical protein